MHTLDIHVYDNLNQRAFRITDNSSYDELLKVSNLLLEVYTPSSDKPSVHKVSKGFSIVLNSNLLQLNSTKTNPPPNLPDGIYPIRISTSPNNKVYAEYYYFRNIKQQNKYLDSLTKLLTDRNKYIPKEFEKKKKELLWIKELIDGAKYLCEDLIDTKAANEVYGEVDNMLNKLCLKK